MSNDITNNDAIETELTDDALEAAAGGVIDDGTGTGCTRPSGGIIGGGTVTVDSITGNVIDDGSGTGCTGGILIR